MHSRWKIAYDFIIVATLALYLIVIYVMIVQTNYTLKVSLLFMLFVVLAIGNNILPLIMCKAKKLKQVTEGNLFIIIQAACKSVNLADRVKIYIRPTNKIRTVNASIQGYSDYSLIINENLVSVLDADEIKAVVYHECYHILKKHDIKRTVNYLFLTIYSFILLFISSLFHMENSVITLVLLIATFIMCTLVFLHFSRRQEIDADAYSVKNIGGKQILIDALTKMTECNHQEKNTFWFRKILSTHPYLDDRIKCIINIAD